MNEGQKRNRKIGAITKMLNNKIVKPVLVKLMMMTMVVDDATMIMGLGLIETEKTGQNGDYKEKKERIQTIFL